MFRQPLHRHLPLTGLLLLTLISVTTSDETQNNGFCKSKDDVDCVDPNDNDNENSNSNNNEKYEQIDESLNSLDQDDPVLIEMVKLRLINQPKTPVPYRLNTDFRNVNKPTGGQYNQVFHLAELFGDQRKGFFIEAGAFDGELMSNTLYFEKKRGWTGLLVEPNPDAFATLRSKNRRATLFGHCLSTKTTPEVVEFDACGLLGGIINNGVKLADDEEFNGFEYYKKAVNQRTIKVQCFPLYSILKALGNPTIDFFSLDIEGAELPVLKTIPWEKVKIRALLIEVNHMGKIFDGNVGDLESFLDEKGFKFYKSVEIDNIYIAKDFQKV